MKQQGEVFVRSGMHTEGTAQWEIITLYHHELTGLRISRHIWGLKHKQMQALAGRLTENHPCFALLHGLPFR